MTERLRDATDEIRRRVSILDVVSPHVTLKRSGRSYKGLCPFHSEKTPSFHVDPEKGFFYCFGCHAGGDVFDFMMRIGSASFTDTLRDLAERAGVRLERSASEDARTGERERLLRVVAEAAAFYRSQLEGDPGRAARVYLDRRGVDAASAEAFLLGYAPPGWDGLLRALRTRGFASAALEQAGLAVARSGADGHYDALRNRLVFPIRDLQGRSVAFGGRALDDSTPKYLNTRETALFTKGKALYALDLARGPIREAGEAVVVEGYMDALACHQFGVRRAVASLGTALTLEQVVLLKRFAARAVLVYDADASGMEAAERGLLVFDQAELPVRVAVLPGQADPDAFLREQGPEAFRRVLESARPIFEYRLAMAESRWDPRSVEGKVGIVNEVSQLILTAPNPVRQGEYVRLLAERLSVREEAIRMQLRRLGERRDESSRALPAVRPVPEAQARAVAEELLLHLLVADPSVRERLHGEVTPETFREAGHRALAEALLHDSGDEVTPAGLRGRLRDEAAISLLSRLLLTEPSVADPRRAALECAQRLRRLTLGERVASLRGQLGEAEQAGDAARRNALLAELEAAYREKERIGS